MRSSLRLTAVIALALALVPADAAAQQKLPSPKEAAAHIEALLEEMADDGDAREAVRAVFSQVDGWRVADELRLLGKTSLATRAAELAGGPDLAGLPAYLLSIAGEEPDPDARAALRLAELAKTKEDWLAVATALAEARDKGDGLERARVALTLGDAHLRTGDFATAAAEYDTAARRCRSVGWLRGADFALNRRLLSGVRSFDWDTAEDSARRVIALQERERLLPNRAAMSRINLGNALLKAGDFEQASTEYELAVDAFERLPDRTGLGRARLALGRAFLRSGRYRDAQFAIEDAIVNLAASNPALASRAQIVLASVHLELGQYEAALGAQTRVHADALARDDDGLRALAAGNIGRTFVKLGRFDEAEERLEEARSVFVESGNPEPICQALINLGYVAWQRRDLPAAKERYVTALAAAEKLNDPWLLCAVLQDLAAVSHAVGERDAAYEHLARADELTDFCKSVKLARDGAFFRLRMALADGHADAAIASARTAIAAVSESIQGLTEDQSVDARQRNAEVYACAAKAAIEADSPAALFEFLEAGRAGTLLESLEGRDTIRQATINEELLTRLEEATRAEARASATYRALSTRGARTPLRTLRAAREHLATATAERTAAIDTIQREASLVADLLYPEPSTLEEAQAALGEGEALVLFAMLPPHVGPNAYALVVQRSAARIVKLGPTEALADACAAPEWRKPRHSADEAMAKVRRLAIDPLKLAVKTKRLLVSPDGPLYQVPFVAVAGGRDVSLVPSATTYLRLVERRGPSGERALVVGDPDYAGRLPQLPGGRDEAKLFQAEKKNLVLIGKAAKEERVRAELGSKTAWNVVHLAAHGREDADRPMQSGIALSAGKANDGWLTAAEVYPLAFRADLVTLSACESGGGRVYRGEGLLGLTRAFLFAGSQRVVCSLWKVDDAATRALMERFYELRGEGLTVGAALTGAQSHVRSRDGWEHPYYWAAWTVWGVGG